MATAPENVLTNSPDETARPPFLRRVRIRGYKSIAFCDVTLEPLTLLVGRNASGKSNILDALAFLRDVIETNVTQATKAHGGWHSILSRSSPNREISFKVEVGLPSAPFSALTNPPDTGCVAEYGFVLAEGPSESPVLIREWFGSDKADSKPYYNLQGRYDASHRTVEYKWDFHHPEAPDSQVPHPRPDRLWLSSFGQAPFINASDSLRFAGFYNFHPEAIRLPQRRIGGSQLNRDGSNLARAIEGLKEIDAGDLARVRAYLSAIVKEVESFDTVPLGEYETVRFRLRSGPRGPLEFDAASMSDGTLRATAALMAAFQIVLPYGHPSLVGIEEPETALHPGAMRALVEALGEATTRTQVLLTTHSPDLLDAAPVRPENIRVVEMVDGQTMITPVDEASLEIVRRNLDTLGGLERQDQLRLDADDLERQRHLAEETSG